MSNLTNIKDSSNNISCLELSAAEDNDEVKQFNLALLYEEEAENVEKAFYWYQKEAENGNNNAQYSLARLYYNGEGTEKNLEKAFYWYQKAAENGNNNAQYNLAHLHYNGEGTEKSLEKAFYWYQKA